MICHIGASSLSRADGVRLRLGRRLRACYGSSLGQRDLPSVCSRMHVRRLMFRLSTSTVRVAPLIVTGSATLA